MNLFVREGTEVVIHLSNMNREDGFFSVEYGGIFCAP
jgi:hypothetical protein